MKLTDKHLCELNGISGPQGEIRAQGLLQTVIEPDAKMPGAIIL